MVQLKPMGGNIGFLRAVVAHIQTLARLSLQNEIPLRAAGISYFLFFALIPILTTFAAVALAFSPLRIEADQAFRFLARWLLPDALLEVEKYIQALAQYTTIISVASIGVTAYLLVKIVFFFEATVNTIWNIPPKRSFRGMMRRALFLCLFVIVVISLDMVVSGYGFEGIIVEVMSTWLFFLGFNKIMPDKRLRWRQVLPGSLLGGTAWYVTKWGFTEYIRHFAKPDSAYGILGVLPLFFLWLHLSITILLLSVCFNTIGRNNEPHTSDASHAFR